MDSAEFKDILRNEPAYRLKQAKKAVFIGLVENWSEVLNLPLDLRRKLEEKFPLKITGENFISKDGRTVKSLILLKDGVKIEAVLMRHERKRNTVCVSSQAGCPLGCVFCATGKAGFKRNLTTSEIVEQVLHFARFLKNKGESRLRPAGFGEPRITNIVFMGMGEPFLNYENVIKAIKILNDKDGFNLGARHFSISTIGIIEGIGRLAEEKLQINLAVSLHAPNDGLRSEIVPINKKYPIREILKTVDEYIKKTKSRVMFEYIMIKDLNDSDECARQLVKLMKPLYFVNLIPYNQTGFFKPSSSARIKIFRKILENNGIAVTQRYRFGKDIKAACGQLAGAKN